MSADPAQGIGPVATDWKLTVAVPLTRVTVETDWNWSPAEVAASDPAGITVPDTPVNETLVTTVGVATVRCMPVSAMRASRNTPPATFGLI
nr:hypothetical protein [Fimbriiglobus ruber]